MTWGWSLPEDRRSFDVSLMSPGSEPFLIYCSYVCTDQVLFGYSEVNSITQHCTAFVMERSRTYWNVMELHGTKRKRKRNENENGK